MEAIGAAASIFAMGQAVHAGVKALRLLRSIPEIQQEYYDLLEEVSGRHALGLCNVPC